MQAHTCATLSMHSPRARKHLCTPIPLHTTVHIHTHETPSFHSQRSHTHTQRPGARTHMYMQVRLQPFARTYMRLPVLTHTHPHACTNLCIARTHRCNSTGLFTRANTRVQLHPCTPHVLAHSCATPPLGAHTHVQPHPCTHPHAHTHLCNPTTLCSPVHTHVCFVVISLSALMWSLS